MKELGHYMIGDSYGGSQDWFTELWMNRGGCGAVTACDVCIYLAKYREMTNLYPFDPQNVTREDFLAFGNQMRPYLSPRHRGINTTTLFIDGFKDYLATLSGPVPAMTDFQGTGNVEDAAALIRSQIDAGLPVPYLMLLHSDKALEDFNRHWFILNGYDDSPEGLMVKAVTYGEWQWFNFPHLWDTGKEEKGGFVILSV